MINNSFEDHIKKSFGNYEPNVPAHVWENIVAGKEKRRPAGWLFELAGNRITFVVLVLILSAGGAVLVNSFDNKNSGKKELAAKEAEQGKTVIQEGKNINNLGTVNTGEVQNEKNSISGQTSTVSGQNIHSAADDATIAEKDNNESTNPTALNNAGHNKEQDNLVAIKQPVTKKNPASFKRSGNDAATTTQSTSGKNNEKYTASKTAVITGSAVSESDTKDITTAAYHNKEIFLEKLYLDLNNAQPVNSFPATVKNHNLPALNIPCPEGEKNAAANKRYFEIYGGPDYVFRTFADTANSTYLQKRRESTSFTSAFSIGFRYTKVFSNAMSFRTGLNYSQVNEKFKYEQGHIIQLVYNIDANGDTTGSYATTGTRYKTTHNRYKTIDIPLIIGYEMGNGKLHTNINAGLVVNVYSWLKGDVLDNAYQPVNITTGKPNSPYQFKTNIGVGFMGGVSFYYKLNDRFHILGEPYFRYNLSAANKSEITLKQKYTTTGLRLGLRIDF